MKNVNIQTAGQLRQFLCNMILGIKNGDLELNKATQITKMAEQITNSLYSEMKMQQLQIAAGRQYEAIGQMALGDVDSSEVIEHE
jgi:hypothetical protein